MILFYLAFSFACVVSLALLRSKRIGNVVVMLFIVAQWALTVFAGLHQGKTDLQFFTFDAIGIIMLTVLSIVSIPAMIHSRIYLNKSLADPATEAIYKASIVLLIVAMSMGYLANHIAMTWVFTEVTTLSAAMLIYHHRSKQALEGTWKYIFICAISVTFIFIGILFLSLALFHAGSSDLSYANLMANREKLDPFWLKLAFIFIFTGYTAKMGLFPMFTAGIDAKDKAPAPSGALLASALVNLGFIGIFRTFAFVNNTALHNWSQIVMITTALITLFVATAYMIKIRNLKRMLAYSGIEHMSIVLLGLTMGKLGCFAAILHLIMHTFVKSGLFFHYNQLSRIYQSKMLQDMGSYFKYNPFGAVVLLLGFVSITAIPPSGMFVSEFMIFKSMVETNQYVLFGIVALLLTVLIWAFSRSILKIIFLPIEDGKTINPIHISPWESVSQLVLFLMAIHVGYNPPAVLINLINEAVTMI
jgi:Formate hydrogenlyase subunit 3/Multisubunit Na+/H+ antiporter, MnhD subunit